MKYIAVVDIPDVLLEEHEEGIIFNDVITVDCKVKGSKEYRDDVYFTIEDVPMRPLPEKIWHEEGKENECEEWHKNGWNACLDEILGDYITQEEADLCGVQFWHDD